MFLPNYEYFLRIAQMKSISRAAESLYISQPALTKYLHKLEAELGVELFERKQGALRITEAGQFLWEYIRRVNGETDLLRAYIEEIKAKGRCTITIGMALWRASVLLPEFLPVFLEHHPLISVQLFEGSAAKMESAIMDDTVDLCIMNLPVNYANVAYEPIFEEHIFLAGSRQDPLIQKLREEQAGFEYPSADIRKFAQKPFIFTQPDQHITEFVNHMLSRLDLALTCVLRTANVTTAINLAASGLGFTFVPELGTRSAFFPADRLSLFTVDDPPLRCTLAAVYKRSSYLSSGAQLFIQELKEFVRQHSSYNG